MKRYLIVQTKRFGDIFQTAHLVSAIQQEGHEVSILCFKEFIKATEVISGLKNVFSLDRKRILSFYKNHIYPDGIAFDEFAQNLSSIKAHEFDYIINLANDRMSTSISSFLGTKQGTRVLGQKISKTNTIEPSDFWSLLFNEVLTTFKASPYHTRDVFHHIALLRNSPHQGSHEILEHNHQNDDVAKNHLEKLRETKGSAEKTFLVGIQLTASIKEKEIPYDSIIELIRLLNNSENLIPILLLAPTSKERELGEKINQEVGFPVVSVEADFKALVSVLKHIDLVVTPDTAIKHLSDLAQTSCLEVSLGNAPVLLQGSVHTKSLIFSKAFSQRSFRISKPENTLSLNIGNDLYQAIHFYFYNKEPNFQDDRFSLFRAHPVKDGIVYLPVMKDFDSDFHLTQLASRLMLGHMIHGEVDYKLCHQLTENFSKKTSLDWIQKQKEEAIPFSRALLKTLKTVIQAQKDIKTSGSFVEALDELLSYADSEKLCAIHALIFRGRIESLSSRTQQENLKEVESLLYELKDFIQAELYTLRAIEIAYDENDSTKTRERIQTISPRL